MGAGRGWPVLCTTLCPTPCLLGPFSLLCPHCLSLLCNPGQPTGSPWTPWGECSASCGPAWRHRHCFCTGPPGGVPSSVVPLPLLASAPLLCPGPEAEEEPCLLLECDRASHGTQTCPLPWPSQAQPIATASSCIPWELEAGILGDPGPAVARAVGGWGRVSRAGPEPVTSPHPRAWGITAKGLGPRGRPARLCHAQVPSRDGDGGQGRDVGKLPGAFWGGEQGGGGAGE